MYSFYLRNELIFPKSTFIHTSTQPMHSNKTIIQQLVFDYNHDVSIHCTHPVGNVMETFVSVFVMEQENCIRVWYLVAYIAFYGIYLLCVSFVPKVPRIAFNGFFCYGRATLRCITRTHILYSILYIQFHDISIDWQRQHLTTEIMHTYIHTHSCTNNIKRTQVEKIEEKLKKKKENEKKIITNSDSHTKTKVSRMCKNENENERNIKHWDMVEQQQQVRNNG